LFEGLVELDEQLNVQPCLANHWDIDSNGLTFTFYLKNDVYFHHSNKKLTAQDFVYTFTRLINPETSSPGAWIFNDKVDGSKQFDKNVPNDQKPFYALNDSILIIRLNKRFPPFVSLLSMPYCFVVRPNHSTASNPGIRNIPVGTGPFSFVKWEEEVSMLFHKNRNYHQPEFPKLDGVIIDLNRNKQAAFMEFIAGKYDFFNGITLTTKDELLTPGGELKDKYKERFNLVTLPFLNMEYIGIYLDSVKFPELSKKEIRTALNLAINRNDLVRFLRNGLGTPANRGFVPVGMGSYDSLEVKGISYNADSALGIMKKHGYSDKKMLSLKLHTTADYTDMAVLIKNQWQKIHVKLDVEVHPGSFLRQIRNQGNAGLFRASWIADYPDPENFLACFYGQFKSPNGPNYTHFSNKKFDSLYSNSMQEYESSKRNELMSKADSILIEEKPVIFLFYDKSVRLVAKHVSGLEGNAMNHLKLKRVSLNK
jgi:oligopeptide transport system substrate-binding protein